MIIVIPLGGIGKRFKADIYTKPKALIEICNKPIISYLLDNLTLEKIDFVYIPYNKEYVLFDFENLLISKYPDIKFKFHCLENNTRGAAETINIALKELECKDDMPVLCLDSDNFYLCDIIKKWDGNNKIFTIKDEDNENIVYSYVKTDDNNNILEIKEKDKISDYACTGAYGFNSIKELEKYTGYIITNNLTQKNEFYTSGVIQSMINDGINFTNEEIMNKHYFSLGTPKQVNEYEHPYIFDLDGTLVNTDHIYTLVWNEILQKYNMSVDFNFFKFYIQGNNDVNFLKEIFPQIKDNEIKDISSLKDKLFIEKLEKYNETIMIEGANKFIKNNKNRRMCIVTSCNKKSAEYIAKKTGIDEYMQFLICSEDCIKHKPNKEPYEKALNMLNTMGKNCIIFEDSNSGYKSAKSIEDVGICLIIKEHSNELIIQTNEYKINNYNEFDVKKIKNHHKNNIKKLVIDKMNKLPIVDVIINNIDMKTGYICDIKSLKLLFNYGSEDVVLKIENDDNTLSDIARKINLYNNEVVFFEQLSNIVGIETPKFFGTIDFDNKKGVLLENLHKYPGSFNLDLNKNIDHILTVVKSVVKMHNQFYFNSENEVIDDMKNVINIKDITYYRKLIYDRFEYFMKINDILLTDNDKKILDKIYNNFSSIIEKQGSYPLNFCHGDLKSPNIYYKTQTDTDIVTPVFLDWQYINLNKGISDIVFLLIESTKYDETMNNIVLNYYYKKSIMYNNFEDLMFDFKSALCIFPFFVMVWFNSENRDSLLDKVFPIQFLKNTLKFYNNYLDDGFFDKFKTE